MRPRVRSATHSPARTEISTRTAKPVAAGALKGRAAANIEMATSVAKRFI